MSGLSLCSLAHPTENLIMLVRSNSISVMRMPGSVQKVREKQVMSDFVKDNFSVKTEDELWKKILSFRSLEEMLTIKKDSNIVLKLTHRSRKLILER